MVLLPFYISPLIVNSSPDLEPIEIENPQTSLFQQKVISGDEEGYKCIACDDFYPMAELNYPEGNEIHFEFKCYTCRKGLRGFFK